MNKYMMLLLLLTNSVIAGPPLMPESDIQYMQERLKAHTHEVKASDDADSLAVCIRNVLQKSSYIGNEAILGGLSDSDKAVLVEADTRNIEIFPIFVPYAEKMSDALASEPVDVFRLAALLDEARRAEQQYKSEQAKQVIQSLSPQGRKIVMAAVSREIVATSYRKLDFAGLAADLPDQVVSMAHSFINSIQQQQNRSTGEPLDQNLSTEDWGVILK